jgi:hypothetical protein
MLPVSVYHVIECESSEVAAELRTGRCVSSCQAFPRSGRRSGIQLRRLVPATGHSRQVGAETKSRTLKYPHVCAPGRVPCKVLVKLPEIRASCGVISPIEVAVGLRTGEPRAVLVDPSRVARGVSTQLSMPASSCPARRGSGRRGMRRPGPPPSTGPCPLWTILLTKRGYGRSLRSLQQHSRYHHRWIGIRLRRRLGGRPQRRWRMPLLPR